MDAVVILIKKNVVDRGTIGHDILIHDADTALENAKCIKFWAPHMKATLEVQTRMKLLEHLGSEDNYYNFPAHDCLTMEMKEIAQKQVSNLLMNDHPNDHDPIRAAQLRKWARDFADLPGLSNQTKTKLMGDLRACITRRWTGTHLLKVSRSDIVRVLDTLST